MRKLLLITLFSILTPGVVPAQLVSVGVKAGVPLTDAFNTSFGNISEARRYTVGPMIELHLPLRFALEFDALYKRTGYSTDFIRVRANSWEFPLLLKYYFSEGALRPYVDIGYAARHISLPRISGRQPWNDPTHAAVISAGLQLRALFLHISPELRYTRWNQSSIDFNRSRGSFVRAVKNQAELLVGLSF